MVWFYELQTVQDPAPAIEGLKPNTGHDESRVGQGPQETGHSEASANHSSHAGKSVEDTSVLPSGQPKLPSGTLREHNGSDSSPDTPGHQGRSLTPEEQEALRLWVALPPELQEVVRALPTLPDALKAAILAMVRAAKG